MNTYPKAAILLFLAFTAGGAAGFFAAKKLLEQHYMELSQLEIDDVKAYYRKKYEGKEPVIVTADTTEEYRKIATRYTKPDLHELANGIKDEDEEIEEDDETDELEEEEYDDLDDDGVIISPIETADHLDPDKEPYLIDYDEFVKPTDIFSKVDLFYYRFDDTVCNADDVIMNEPEDILGWEWMKILETKTTAFVRNEGMATDFEIHSFSKSYKEEVAARLETDKEKKFRRMARKKEAMDSSSDEFIEHETLAKKEEEKKKAAAARKAKRLAAQAAEEE